MHSIALSNYISHSTLGCPQTWWGPAVAGWKLVCVNSKVLFGEIIQLYYDKSTEWEIFTCLWGPSFSVLICMNWHVWWYVSHHTDSINVELYAFYLFFFLCHFVFIISQLCWSQTVAYTACIFCVGMSWTGYIEVIVTKLLCSALKLQVWVSGQLLHLASFAKQ